MEDSWSQRPTMQDFPNLTGAHWVTLEKMVRLLDEAASTGFPNLAAEQQKARVEPFDKNESSLIAPMSAAAQESTRTAMPAEPLGAAKASTTTSAPLETRSIMTKPVKMLVPTVDVKNLDSLVFWAREFEIALSPGQIYDVRAQVGLALAKLGGCARARHTHSVDSVRVIAVSVVTSLNTSVGIAPLTHVDRTWHAVFGSTDNQQHGVDSVGKRRLPVNVGRHTGRLRSSLRKGIDSPPHLQEKVPETPLLCLSVAAARPNLVVVTASSSHSNTDVSVRLATGSIVSTGKVILPWHVKFDDFDSVEPFIVLDMNDRYDLILGMPWLAKHEPWIDWSSRTIGASHKPLVDRALAGHAPSPSRDGFEHDTVCPEANNTMLPLWKC
ncbi:unnamed protein product [Phytophthora fragariaefolia]|uniref:Unnamed protein product n=1 Tax=Phytophthora fragariaefolia TaxID=1490495 RepID=A0A9W6U0J9_9STRA|nr:unnamed protein product [Phytophthora fragariaefolia]